MLAMQPLAETVEAIDELDPATDEGELLDLLIGLGSRAHEVVPNLLAVSVSRVGEHLTFTVVSGPEDAVARAVQSSLTLPVLGETGVVLAVDLYASSPGAFSSSRRDELAEVFGAWIEGAVMNGDLSFTTLQEAKDAPRRVRERAVIDVGIGIVAARRGVDVETAERWLEDIADRRGMSAVDLARSIVSMTVQDRHSQA